MVNFQEIEGLTMVSVKIAGSSSRPRDTKWEERCAPINLVERWPHLDSFFHRVEIEGLRGGQAFGRSDGCP
jgi:hypothetical protein